MTPTPSSIPFIDSVVAGLDAWLDTMRGPEGYGGPVAHWWQQSLVYTGAAMDWRYEGIIAGYLLLWQRTGQRGWLDKARRAGDDLLRGQMANGHFAASAFEGNPATAGTPHEAACDVGLLLLALALRQDESPDWQTYAACAERNVRTFYVEQLWDDTARAFRDSPDTPSFVPNKAATACEAFFLLAELQQDAHWVEQYVLPTLDRLLDHQCQQPGQFNGAIAQNSFGSQVVEKYFPKYIARCVPALLRAYRWSGSERYAEGALQAMRFIARWCYIDGSLPTVIYPNRQVNRYPCWVAPLGDILRAADEVRTYGFDDDLSATIQFLLAGADSSGGIQTARGFAAQAGGKAGPDPDIRDVLHVVGWSDKVLRYLAAHTSSTLPPASSGRFSAACTFRGQPMWLTETSTMLEIAGPQGICYHWQKGEPWPRIASQEFWLR